MTNKVAARASFDQENCLEVILFGVGRRLIDRRKVCSGACKIVDYRATDSACQSSFGILVSKQMELLLLESTLQ